MGGGEDPRPKWEKQVSILREVDRRPKGFVVVSDLAFAACAFASFMRILSGGS